MAEFFVPCNLWMGREAGEASGTGVAVGDTAQVGLFSGVDYMPAEQPDLGGLNHMSLGLYASDSTGDDSQAQPAAMAAGLDYVRQAGGGVSIERNGALLRLPDCGAAFPRANGGFYIDPSDVGTGPGQIPPTPATLAASQLAGHPSVFVRNPNRCRGITSQQPHAGQPNATLPVLTTPTVAVWTVTEAPDASRWTFVLDGTAMVMDVAHPVGSNLRRPADVWNAIITGLIELPQPTSLTRVAGTAPPFFMQPRGQISNFSYLDYARFENPVWFDGSIHVENLYQPA